MIETFEFVVPMEYAMARATAHKMSTDSHTYFVVQLTDPRILLFTRSSIIKFQFFKGDQYFAEPSISYSKILPSFKSPNRGAEKWIIEGLRIREKECLLFA